MHEREVRQDGGLLSACWEVSSGFRAGRLLGAQPLNVVHHACRHFVCQQPIRQEEARPEEDEERMWSVHTLGQRSLSSQPLVPGPVRQAGARETRSIGAPGHRPDHASLPSADPSSCVLPFVRSANCRARRHKVSSIAWMGVSVGRKGWEPARDGGARKGDDPQVGVCLPHHQRDRAHTPSPASIASLQCDEVKPVCSRCARTGVEVGHLLCPSCNARPPRHGPPTKGATRSCSRSIGVPTVSVATRSSQAGPLQAVQRRRQDGLDLARPGIGIASDVQ